MQSLHKRSATEAESSQSDEKNLKRRRIIDFKELDIQLRYFDRANVDHESHKYVDQSMYQACPPPKLINCPYVPVMQCIDKCNLLSVLPIIVAYMTEALTDASALIDLCKKFDFATMVMVSLVDQGEAIRSRLGGKCRLEDTNAPCWSVCRTSPAFFAYQFWSVFVCNVLDMTSMIHAFTHLLMNDGPSYLVRPLLERILHYTEYFPRTTRDRFPMCYPMLVRILRRGFYKQCRMVMTFGEHEIVKLHDSDSLILIKEKGQLLLTDPESHALVQRSLNSSSVQFLCAIRDNIHPTSKPDLHAMVEIALNDARICSPNALILLSTSWGDMPYDEFCTILGLCAIRMPLMDLIAITQQRNRARDAELSKDMQFVCILQFVSAVNRECALFIRDYFGAKGWAWWDQMINQMGDIHAVAYQVQYVLHRPVGRTLLMLELFPQIDSLFMHSIMHVHGWRVGNKPVPEVLKLLWDRFGIRREDISHINP